jgi:hypothetical protein
MAGEYLTRISQLETHLFAKRRESVGNNDFLFHIMVRRLRQGHYTSLLSLA